jgi:hypothetical protein
MVSFAQAWLEECRKLNPGSRATTGRFQKGFLHNDGGPARLHALIFAKLPVRGAHQSEKVRPAP